MVGNNIKEPFFVGVLRDVSIVVAFYQILYKLNVTLINRLCFALVSDLVECVLDQHLRGGLVLPSCELGLTTRHPLAVLLALAKTLDHDAIEHVRVDPVAQIMHQASQYDALVLPRSEKWLVILA